MAGKVQIYQPVSKTDKNIHKLLKLMLNDLISSKELIWRLFLRDFQAKYRQSLLGWGWAFLVPLIAVGTFFILRQSALIYIINLPVPYPIYGLLGISLWQVFASGLSRAAGSLTEASSFITKVRFPREALILAAYGQALVEFSIRIVLVVVIYFLYGLKPSLGIVLTPILILPLVFFTLGLSFIASLLNAIIRDIQNLINIALTFLLFLMPIMYTLPETTFLHQVNQYNPLFFLVIVPREIIINGRTEHLGQFLISSLLALIIFILGWLIFNQAQTKIAEAA